MKKDLCRYDYAAQAVDALNTYVKTCPGEMNTLELIKRAHSATLSLKKIEESIDKRWRSGKINNEAEPVGASIVELLDLAKQLDPVIEQTDRFLSENKDILEDVRKAAETIDAIRDLNAELGVVRKKTKRSIKRVRRIAGAVRAAG